MIEFALYLRFVKVRCEHARRRKPLQRDEKARETPCRPVGSTENERFLALFRGPGAVESYSDEKVGCGDRI
jgi:hypothetical protein